MYSKYIESRLNRDAARVTERYEIGTEEVAEIAEEIAFSITADRQIGLTPRRSELWAAMQRQRFRRSRSRILKALDALEYMKLGKQDASDGTSDPQFTFAHRRFQEYFATSIVVRDTARVMPGMLLLDARWRETAVVICQTGRDADSAPLLCEISTFLAAAAPPTGPETVIDQSGKRKFAWQPATIHVLGILQDGYSARMESLPTPIRKLAGRIVSAGFHDGDFLDKKFALEVAGTAPERDLVELLRIGLTLDSPVINDVVYRQVARLLVPPPDLMTALRLAVLRLTFESWPVWNRVSINAFVRRVPQAPELADAAHLALWIGPIGSILAALIVVPLSLSFTPLSAAVFMAILACTSTYRVKKYFVWSGRYIERMHFILSLVVLQLLILAPIKSDIDLERFELLIRTATETNPQLAVSRLFQDMFLTFVNLPSATLYMISCSAVLTIYALAWHLASIYAVRSGTYLRPLYWPFTPFSLARPLIAYLKDLKVLEVITPILPVIIITGIIFLAVETIFFIGWENLLVPIVVILGPIVGLPIIVASCRVCVRFLRDTWRTKRWFKQMKSSVSGSELGRIYHLARTECGRAALLERVRGRGVVENEAASAERVQQLASYIDARIAGDTMCPLYTTAQIPFGRFWRWLDTSMDSLDWSLHKRYLNRQRDSIYLILEPNRRSALTEYGAPADTGRPTEPG